MPLHNPTPLYRFAQGSIFERILIKREDLSECGSHKFRYFSEKLRELAQQGVRRIVLSTTGNAGITAAIVGKELGIGVYCLMSDKGDMNKAAEIVRNRGRVFVSSRPIRFAKYLARKLACPLLKTSVDGAEYYESLGRELMEQVPEADIVVNFATSGTSSVGIMQAYERAGKALPELHIVQAGKSCSIAGEFLQEQDVSWEDGVGLADTPRRKEVLQWIKKSDGKAWYVLKKNYEETMDELKQLDLGTSWEGTACFWVAKEQLMREYPEKNIVVVFSGRDWKKNNELEFERLESVGDVEREVSGIL